MGSGSKTKPPFTKRLQIPPRATQQRNSPAREDRGCPQLCKLRIEENGEAHDPETGNIFEFNLRGLPVVQELRQDRDLTRCYSVYASLYRLSPDEAREEVTEFLERLERLGLYRFDPRTS